MTEEDAKTKWCPFSRVALGWSQDTARRGSGQELAATVNRGDNLSGHTECIGSACMAWRWDAPVEVYGHDPRGLPGSDVGLDPAIVGTARRFLPREGYCGLAGKP